MQSSVRGQEAHEADSAIRLADVHGAGIGLRVDSDGLDTETPGKAMSDVAKHRSNAQSELIKASNANE